MLRHRVRNAAKKVVKAAVLPWAWFRRDRTPGLFVLIYHRVGAGMPEEMDVSVERFRAQMRYVKDRFEVVQLGDALDALLAGEAPVRDRVAITFDDGYREVATKAFPVLQELGLPATVFVATGFMDGSVPAPLSRTPTGGAPPRAMTWGELDELIASGSIEVGSHSVTHRDFDTISAADAEEECARSADAVAERTGMRPSVFAYPRGVVEHEDVVARHYRAALAVEGAKNHPGLVATRVARVPVRDSDGIAFFRARLAGIAPLEDRVYAGLR